MKRLGIFVVLIIVIILFNSLSYADLMDQQIIIKGPELIKSNPVSPGSFKDIGDEICIVGHGADLEKAFDKQKAFVAAFCDALRNIIQIQKGVVTQSSNKVGDNTLSQMIDILMNGRIGNFEIVSNTRTDDLTLIEDKIIVKYNDITITIINSVLVSPTVEKINFIQWDHFPQTIGGVEIMDVTFNNNGICEVQLSCKDKKLN